MLNERQTYRDFPYPRTENLIVYRRVSTRNEERDVPVYGTKHPDSKRFPDHKLTKIERVGDSRAKGSEQQVTSYILYYAADVQNQDLDNWQHTVADIGGNRFSAVRRLYVTDKDSYDPLVPAMGTAMPNIPKDKFTETFVLAQRRQVENPNDTIASLYVLEEHVYVKKVTITESSYDKVFGVPIKSVTTLYYKGEVYDATPDPDVTIEDAVNNHFSTYFGRISGGIVSVKQLSENWWAVTNTDNRESAITGYTLTYPSYLSLSLPDILQSISVSWQKQESTGEYNGAWDGDADGDPQAKLSLSGSERATASAGCSLKPAPILDIQRGFSGRVPVTVHIFYCEAGDAETRINALGSPWPKFLPVSHTISIRGGAAQVQVQADARATSGIFTDPDGEEGYAQFSKNEGSGFSKDVSGSIQTITIPPTIHGIINIGGILSDTATASASCDVGWTGRLNFPNAVANASESIDVSGAVTPTTLPATNQTEIPSSGSYVLKAVVSPFEYPYVQVAAYVFDASYLA